MDRNNVHIQCQCCFQLFATLIDRFKIKVNKCVQRATNPVTAFHLLLNPLVNFNKLFFNFSLRINFGDCFWPLTSDLFWFFGQVYPTHIRSIGLGMCSSMARFGPITTPFFAQVGRLDTSIFLEIISLEFNFLIYSFPVQRQGSSLCRHTR